MKEDILYLRHIAQAISRIELYLENITEEEFKKNFLVQDGVIRQIEIIGEATKNLSKSITRTFVHIDWEDIAGMRDKLIHHYMGVDIEVVWDTAKQDVPVLKEGVEKIIEMLTS